MHIEEEKKPNWKNFDLPSIQNPNEKDEVRNKE